MRTQHQNETNAAVATAPGIHQNQSKDKTSNKLPLGQRKPWNSFTSQALGKLEKSPRSTFSSQSSSSNTSSPSTSQPSSPTTRCQRSLDTYKYPTKKEPPPKDIYALKKHVQVKPNNNNYAEKSAQQQQTSSPRRKTLLRQSALENSKESLTGDEKPLTKSFQPYSIVQKYKIRKEQTNIRSPYRECMKRQNSVLLGQPTTERQNKPPKTFQQMNNLCNDDNNNYGSKNDMFFTSNTITGLSNLHSTKKSSPYETKHRRFTTPKCQKGKDPDHHINIFESKSIRQPNRLSSAANWTSKHSGNKKSICRGVSPSSSPEIETNNVSNAVSCSQQQSPSPHSSTTTSNLIVNTLQQDNKATTIHNIPSTSAALSNKSNQRDININSIDTNQEQSTLRPTSTTIHEDHQHHLPYKSNGRESNLIKIPRHGQGQPRDKIQLDQRNLQKSLIRKLTRDSLTSSSGGDSKNKTMSNPSTRNFVKSQSSSGNKSEQQQQQYTSWRKTPGITSSNGGTSTVGTGTSTTFSSSRVNPIGSGIVRRILNKIENKSASSDTQQTGKKMNGFRKHKVDSHETKPIPEVLQFLQPLPPSLEVMEGSEISLTVKAKGATKIVWVKNNKIIPNSPPDFEYKSNSVDGTYSLKIRDCFIEDTGIYICEAYGIDSDLACWCNVKVIEEIEDDASLELTDEILEEQAAQNQKNHKFIVPVIITSNASSPEPSEIITMEEATTTSSSSAINKRLEFKQCKETSIETSREIFEDARENLDEEEIVVESLADVSKKETSSQEDSPPSTVYPSRTEPELYYLNGEHEEQHSADLSEITESYRDKSSPEIIQTEIELHSKPSICETTEIPLDEVLLKEIPCKEEIVEAEHESSILPISEEDTQQPIPIKQAIQSEIPTDFLHEEVLELSSETPEPQDTFKEPLPATKEVRVSSSVSTEEEISSAEVQSRSYSSQSSRESFGEPIRVSGDGSGSDTIFTPSPFEEPHHHVQSSSIAEDTKSIGGSSSLGSSSLRDSFSSPVDPRILMGPGNLIVMLGETVNLRVKIQTSDVSGTTVSWCKFVCGKYRRLGTSKPDSSDSSSRQTQQSTNDDDQSIVVQKMNESSDKGRDRKEEDPPHIQICKTNGESSDLITLRITNANYEDSGKYRVKAQNQLGVDYHQCILSVEGPPVPPAASPNVAYEEKSHSILVSWSCCPYDGGSAVTGYVLEVLIHPPGKEQRAEAHTWVTLTPSNFQRLCYTLKNPESGFSYQFRVSVENAYGKGKTSSESEVVVVPEFSGVSPVASASSSDYNKKNVNSLEDMMRKISLSKDLSDDEIAYEYKDVTLKHESFHEYYDKFEQLGKGRFGVVFKVLNKTTQNPYAGKFVKCIKAKDKERAQLEFQIMNELKYHPKLICLVDAFQMPREIVIVTEMINGGELFERVVADDFTLTEHDCIIFLRQICDGVNYIHEKNIMHLDLKPENILCTTKTSNKIKIIDFGLAQHYNPKEPIRVLFGTAEFVSPEIINYDTICPATDMWSVGVITYILLSGLSPFLGDNDNETFSNITRGDFDFEDEAFDKISEDAKEFISSLILKRKEDRLTAKECLSHKWLALSDEEKRDIVLPTDKLKRFLLRRKWQKTGHAIRAIGRITTLYSSRRSSGGSSSTSSSSPMSLSLHRSLSAQESFDDSVFGSVDIPENSQPSSGATTRPSPPPIQHTSSFPSEPMSTLLESSDNLPNNKPKYNDSSRSDSGICDVVPDHHNKT